MRGLVAGLRRCSAGVGCLLALLVLLGVWPQALVPRLGIGAAEAAPGLCVGPVCADGIQRSAQNHVQLRLRLADQQGHHERVMVDCRNGQLSPASGPVERGFAAAVARRVCRLAGDAPS